MKIQHYGAKDLFLDIIAWLCETPKSSFAFGFGLGMLINSVPMILLPPFLLFLYFTGRSFKKLEGDEKIPDGNLYKFLTGFIAGLFSGALIFSIWLAYNENQM